MYDFDLSGVFYLAIIGLAAIALAVLVGIPLGGWWLYHHIQLI